MFSTNKKMRFLTTLIFHSLLLYQIYHQLDYSIDFLGINVVINCYLKTYTNLCTEQFYVGEFGRFSCFFILKKKSTCQLTGTKIYIKFLIKLECSFESSPSCWLPSPVRCTIRMFIFPVSIFCSSCCI